MGIQPNPVNSSRLNSRTFSQIIARKMKATITAALIGIFLLAGVPDIFAKPGYGWDPAPDPDPAPLCECINPHKGTTNAYRGNPDALCGPGGPGYCYVDCNGACCDQQPTASPYRCQSTAACDVHNGGPGGSLPKIDCASPYLTESEKLCCLNKIKK